MSDIPLNYLGDQQDNFTLFAGKLRWRLLFEV